MPDLRVARPDTIRTQLEAIRHYTESIPPDDRRGIDRDNLARAVAALDLLGKHESHACTVTGELVSCDDAEIYGRAGHRIEPEGGCVWTDDDWCECQPERVAVVPDPERDAK